MKPLELTVYPLDDRFPAGYTMPRNSRISFRAANSAAQAKRFTDTELAAEVWRARWTKIFVESYRDKLTERQESMVDTVERFATLPHHDEVTP